jgi:hypothetical protein
MHTTTNLGNVRIRALAVVGPNLFAGTNINGIFLSTNNGTNWSQVNTGFACTNIYCLSTSASRLYAGGLNGIGAFLTTDGGSTWTDADNGLNNKNVHALVSDGSIVFAGTGGGGVYLSTNSGTNWTSANNELPDTVVNALALYGTSLFAGTGSHGVFLSTNNGASWAAANSGLSNAAVYAFYRSGMTLVACASTGVFLTTDNGTSWTVSDSTLPIHAIAGNSTTLFASDGGGDFYTSTDNGRHWIWNPKVHGTINSILANDAYVIVGGNLGIGVSTNNGATWYGATSGLTNYFLTSLAVNGTNLFAGTLGSGVWKVPLTDLGIVSSIALSSSGIPDRFNLEQNYPNPFNPSTTIRYGLHNRAHVSLTVFNTLGQQMAQLVNEELEAGFHEVKFDGRTLSSGVYFYKLQAGSYVETRKLILLR